MVTNTQNHQIQNKDFLAELKTTFEEPSQIVKDFLENKLTFVINNDLINEFKLYLNDK